jgi:chromosome partitioning protein
MKTTILSICNLKGGTGKTTTTLNLGAALNREGKNVLLIDFDPQGNLTEALGLQDKAEERDIYRSLRHEAPLQPLYVIEPDWCVGKGESGCYDDVRGNLHEMSLIPATLDLAAAEHELSAETGGSYVLRELLEPLRGKYDYILIDCSPSIGAMVINALTASDALLIPIQAEYLPIQGLKKLTDVIQKVQRRLNKDLFISGILVTQYDGRTVLSRQIADSVQERFRSEMYQTKIRQNVAIVESQAQGLDIFRYAPDSAGAQDYAALAKEVIARHG